MMKLSFFHSCIHSAIIQIFLNIDYISDTVPGTQNIRDTAVSKEEKIPDLI